MTTNCPEKLDPVLIRPGRINLQVEFTNATKFHAKEIFERMYAADLVKTDTSTNVAATTSSVKEKATPEEGLFNEELRTMALEFASHIPDGIFSPAEIQEFLLNRRKEAKKAVEEVGAWVEVLLESKKKGKKVVGTH
jgi:chaperone BCS1